jgi:hypothetical protein
VAGVTPTQAIAIERQRGTGQFGLLRRHHRLKTHAHGWRYVMPPDGVLVVTTPTGVTRVSRPPGMGPDDDPVLRVSSERAPSDPDPPPF